MELQDLGKFQSKHIESPEVAVRSLAPLSPFRAKAGVCPSHRVLESHWLTSCGFLLRQTAQALRPRVSEATVKDWSLVPEEVWPTLLFRLALAVLVLRVVSSFGRLAVSAVVLEL